MLAPSHSPLPAVRWGKLATIMRSCLQNQTFLQMLLDFFTALTHITGKLKPHWPHGRLLSWPRQLAVWSSGMILAQGARGPGFNSQNSPCFSSANTPRNAASFGHDFCTFADKSGHPESNQGPSDGCKSLQSDALPTEL